ncbi:short-subunit dehydrogenase [Catenuloplanes nepalensis]|uniref:Short-subunit dehydrogenase n=1 Tax=Catenuloplanes nepalensis TaxID=587533 RepID=A0ABT9N629_9ACTN|nr:SDR family NAD(P)-dependent oxidoreductase [Catenuloplanes nepalensis]MDP9798990.1 short-subunit dehydrogenase [Catenuloplanes nepalensis]
MGRVVVVSGGGTGTGQATAARFARDGADVVIVGRRADVLARAAEGIEAQDAGSVPAITADLTDADAALRVRDEVAERHGKATWWSRTRAATSRGRGRRAIRARTGRSR